MSKYKKIIIVGAGMTGLVAGYRLLQKGHEVEIYEKGKTAGGLLSGFKINDTNIEKAYHHVFQTDKYIIDLIKELGLEEKLKWHQEKTALYYSGEMYSFMGAVDLLKFKPLDLISKIRLGLVKIWLEKDNNWHKYENVTAVEWMKKYCGEKAYKVIWEPLLKGKFHDHYKNISMAWLWARIHTRANSDGFLGYMDGGFQQIIENLELRIKNLGGKIYLETEYNPSKSPFDKGDFTTIYTGPSKEVEYLGAVNVVFTSKQNLSKYYWHNINDLKSPFLAFIQHTNLVDKKFYGGEHVYYLGTYVPHEHRYFSVSDEEIKKEFFKYLKNIFPDFEQPKKVWVNRFKNAQHIVGTNYQIPKSKINPSPLRGAPLDKGAAYGNYYVANFAQIYPEDRGINFAVREGEKVAELLSNN